MSNLIKIGYFFRWFIECHTIGDAQGQSQVISEVLWVERKKISLLMVDCDKPLLTDSEKTILFCISALELNILPVSFLKEEKEK